MLNLNINLAKVKDAYIAPLENGTMAVVIPATGVWIPDDQSKSTAILSVDVYRHMPNQYDKTALCRQHFSAKYLDSLTEAERNALPTIGSGK